MYDAEYRWDQKEELQTQNIVWKLSLETSMQSPKTSEDLDEFQYGGSRF